MAPPETSSAGTQERESRKEANPADLHRRAAIVHTRARRFMTTLVETKASSANEIADLERYFRSMRLEEGGLSGIRDREVFFEGESGSEGWGTKMERDAIALHKDFTTHIDRAVISGLISEKSKRNWMERFENKSVGFKAKEYWVHHQLPHYINGWQKVVDEQKVLAADPKVKDLAQYEPALAAILDKNAFLDLHFDKRKDLLAKARAAKHAANKLQLDLYATAKGKLQGAVSQGILSPSNVGMWLERIFKSNANPKKIEAVVNGTAKNSMSDFMLNWYNVRKRYDEVSKKFKGNAEETAPRGLHLLTPSQFLSLHYAQRLRYVEEMERRLTDSPDPWEENRTFLKIRHAIDVKDWEEAADQIAVAKGEALSEPNKERLASMERYVKQFNSKPISKTDANVTEARKRMDSTLESLQQSHSQLYPMVLRLLKGPNANRNINQFRWIVYNEDWCETHGFLNQDIARRGAAKENEERTRQRALRGEDIGRNDVLGATTAGQQFMRKREYATHKATFQHVDVSDGGAIHTAEEWLKQEQDPRDLYWRTFIANENGDPKSHNWHKDLLFMLSSLRADTRVLRNAGFMYDSPASRLISRN